MLLYTPAGSQGAKPEEQREMEGIPGRLPRANPLQLTLSWENLRGVIFSTALFGKGLSRAPLKPLRFKILGSEVLSVFFFF